MPIAISFSTVTFWSACIALWAFGGMGWFAGLGLALFASVAAYLAAAIGVQACNALCAKRAQAPSKDSAH